MSTHYNKKRLWQSSRNNTRKKKPIQRRSSSKLEGISKFFDFFKTPKVRNVKGKSSLKVRNKDYKPTHKAKDLIKDTGSGSKDDIKVFKPANDSHVFNPVSNAKQSLLHNHFSKFSKSKEKKFQWGVKSVENIRSEAERFSPKNLWMGLKFQIKKYRVFERFNSFMLYTTLASLCAFFIYLCFFDTFFLIKDYRVTFSQSSYLSPEDVDGVVDTIKEDRLFGIIPNNQFWYLSSRSLTLAAQSEHPEIELIEVTRKMWPNQAELEIQTEPILITLGINNSEYWRIGYDGSVVSTDAGGLRENLVIVERPVRFNRPEATLQDYSFAGNCDENNTEIRECLQLNRFWFVVWLWNILDLVDIDYSKTILPSLFDTDVVIELSSGSQLIFDSGIMSKEVQRDRIVSVLDSIIGGQVNSGEIVYIDFRQPKKVYLCRVGQACV
jgi:hypothetical protein